MTNPYKPYIQSVRPYEPGKPVKELERELGLKNIVKLASNENPLGPSPKALRAMRKAIQEAHLYPESACPELVRGLSKRWKVSPREIIAGNGSNEIIELLARGFLSEGDEVVSSETSFLVYPILSQVLGAKYISVPMRDYTYDLEGIAQAVTARTKLIFVANPNNPTGTYVNAGEVERFLARIPDSVVVCFDEAYVDFAGAKDFPRMVPWIAKRQNLILLRTFSKSYGLAGLRVGYGLGDEALIQYLHRIRQPFNVNAVAQAAAAAALEDEAFLRKTQRLIFRGRKFFYEEFRKLGLQYLPSQANFVLVNVGKSAKDVFQDLLKDGMIIRSMAAYGLATWVRVTVGTAPQNLKFIRLLRRSL